MAETAKRVQVVEVGGDIVDGPVEKGAGLLRAL